MKLRLHALKADLIPTLSRLEDLYSSYALTYDQPTKSYPRQGVARTQTPSRQRSHPVVTTMASDTTVAVETANIMPEFQSADFCFLRTSHFKTDIPRIPLLVRLEKSHPPSHSFSLLHAVSMCSTRAQEYRTKGCNIRATNYCRRHVLTVKIRNGLGELVRGQVQVQDVFASNSAA